MSKPTSLVLCFTAKHIHCQLPTSSYPDGGYRNHVGVAHSYCYKLLVWAKRVPTFSEALTLSIFFFGSCSTAFHLCKIALIYLNTKGKDLKHILINAERSLMKPFHLSRGNTELWTHCPVVTWNATMVTACWCILAHFVAKKIDILNLHPYHRLAVPSTQLAWGAHTWKWSKIPENEKHWYSTCKHVELVKIYRLEYAMQKGMAKHF